MTHTRRELIQGAAVGGGAAGLLGGFGFNPLVTAAMAKEAGKATRPLKAAFSNAGLQATWCAQGKQAAEYWGSLFNVEVTWFDGQLDAVKQRSAIDNMASQKWDFVAIQAFGIGTLTAPVNKMIEAGIPVIDMDTLIAPLDTINVLSFLAPDNEFMGASVTQALVNAINGEGTIVMTQGALGHTGAQGRARGFKSVVSKFPKVQVLDEQPADWDVTKVARIWETLLTKYPKIDAAFFHNDDMALAAAKVMQAKGRTETKIGGVDAMPPAIKAVQGGQMYATVRNPSCRIHGGAVSPRSSTAPRPVRIFRRTSSPTGRSSPRPTPTACCGWRTSSSFERTAGKSSRDGSGAARTLRHLQIVRRRAGPARRRFFAEGRRDPRSRRRERRRQEHADEDHSRRACRL
jgi:ribose transport system substrate-binding protein